VEAHDWCGLSAGIQPGCPIVVRCHGSSVYFGAMLNEPVRRSVRLAEQTALRGASAVAAVSRFTATETARLFGLQRPVAVLPNGVDLAQFQVPRSGEADPTTLVYVGTIVRKKGVLDLCRAFSRVVVDVPDARLVLLGKDARDRLTGRSTWDLCQAELSEAARRRVEYPGPQPYERVQDFIRRGAACVLPSHAEALPLAWLEAMACAKPVVAYDIGWAPEIVEHERTGLLAPHGDVAHLSDAVVRILRQPAWGTALGRAGRAAIEARFSDQVAAAQSVAWYRQVLDGTC
jgi:glycosyltransferase involved in cell wall biosynthesis